MKRNWASARREIEGRSCLVCGNPWVDPAHLWQRNRLGDESPENIAPLCRSHHEAFDHHELDLLPYLSFPKVAKVMELAAKWSRQRSNGMELARERLLPSEYESKRVPRVAALDKLGEAMSDEVARDLLDVDTAKLREALRIGQETLEAALEHRDRAQAERDALAEALREARRQVADARSFSYRSHRDRAEKAEAQRDALAEALRDIDEIAHPSRSEEVRAIARAALDKLGERDG